VSTYFCKKKSLLFAAFFCSAFISLNCSKHLSKDLSLPKTFRTWSLWWCTEWPIWCWCAVKKLGYSHSEAIGIDFHRAMVASDPVEQLLTGRRRPMRNWISDMNLHIVLRKINKNCCHQSCTLWLQYAPNRFNCRLGLCPRPRWGSWQHSPNAI